MPVVMYFSPAASSSKAAIGERVYAVKVQKMYKIDYG